MPQYWKRKSIRAELVLCLVELATQILDIASI